MSDILATPDSGNWPHPRQNGHRATLLVEDLHPYEVQDYELTAELQALVAEATLADQALLPGFECLTWADLDRAALPPCPDWCVHTDEHDTDDETSEHRGVQHTIRIAQGGATFGDHDPNATISMRLEQDRDDASAPRIVLELTIDNIPHEAYIDPREADTLRHIIAQLLHTAAN